MCPLDPKTSTRWSTNRTSTSARRLPNRCLGPYTLALLLYALENPSHCHLPTLLILD
ncbi:hypothetical protein [Actinoalloteichus fjordicus]|uniref:hypothetical protein n=1 Tax=Actinoalloteichus fjordicus TaxID=1612552 RepID=UPI0012F76107|nr:hypothetical protein [Actinoalloteichus fjordicus]